MKQTLKDILQKDDSVALESYIAGGQKIDYSFSLKMGDYQQNVSPLVFCCNEKKTSCFLTLFNKAPEEMVRGFFTQFPGMAGFALNEMTKSGNFSKTHPRFHLLLENKKVSGELLTYLPSDTSKILSYPLISCLPPAKIISRFLGSDDFAGLGLYLDTNNLKMTSPELSSHNFLMEAIKLQAVDCFDLLKERIKSEKKPSQKPLSLP